MVVPAKAVFRPSGFFLNLVVRNENGLGTLTRLVVAFSLREAFWGKIWSKEIYAKSVDFWTNLRCSILKWPPDEAPYMGKKKMMNTKTDGDERNLQWRPNIGFPCNWCFWVWHICAYHSCHQWWHHLRNKIWFLVDERCDRDISRSSSRRGRE